MTVPARFSQATPTEEAERLRAILDGRDWKPDGAVRVRRSDGAMGWRRDGVIYPDYEPDLSMLCYWMTNSEWSQQDYGLPAEGWQAFDGWWFDA